MKKIIIIVAIFVLSMSQAFAKYGFRSMTLGGATGIIVTPDARVPFSNADTSVDTGVHYLQDGESIIPKVTVGLFKRWEIGGAFDLQGTNSNDVLLHSKLRFSPWASGNSSSALAIGGNYQNLNNGGVSTTSYQVYLAATYAGTFFGNPAETTVTIGSTEFTSAVDFGMGFDVNFMPQYLKGFVHWVTDFSNFSYSRQAQGANVNRAMFNTGVRIAVLHSHSRLKLNVDLLGLDLLDTNRSFSAGLNFGMSI